MSFVDRVIHILDDTRTDTYYEDCICAIKEHIEVLLNAKEQSAFYDLDLNTKNLAAVVSDQIYRLITAYERRVQILGIEYDEILMPWQLRFFVRFCYRHDNFREFSMQIVFKNNRYCEVM